MIYKIRFKPKGRKLKTVRGKIIKEYDDFYLIQTANYKTCVNKRNVILGETEMEAVG